MRIHRRLLLCLIPVGVLAATTAAAFAATTSWGTAIDVPGLENFGDDGVWAISCASPGNCAAVGSFRKGPAFVVDEKDGVWGTAVDVKYGVWDGLDSISCATAGSCAAGGSYFDGGELDHGLLVNKRHGVWAAPIGVPGMTQLAHGSSSISTISCTKPGFCAAGGYYFDSSGPPHAFVVNETGGVWHKASKVAGLAVIGAGGAVVTSISCVTARSCTAGGSGFGENPGRAFVVEEKNGTWGKAVEVPGLAALAPGGQSGVTSVSCSSAGSCAAGGNYSDGHGLKQAFVVNKKHGVWRKAIAVPGLVDLNLGGAAQMYSISCASVSSCDASGSYTDGSANIQAFVVSKKKGRWRKAIEVPGLAVLNVGGTAETYSVSCAKAGFCGAGGYYMDGSGGRQAFVVSETNGVWNTAVEVPGSAALNNPGPGLSGAAAVHAVSCGGARSCVAGGYYVGGAHLTQGFVTAP